MELKDFIKNGMCKFSFLRAGRMFYDIEMTELEGTSSTKRYYRFSIPLDDVGGATFNASERPINLMRWIRKAIDSNELMMVSLIKKQEVL